jgi:hypothetical protein
MEFCIIKQNNNWKQNGGGKLIKKKKLGTLLKKIK